MEIVWDPRKALKLLAVYFVLELTHEPTPSKYESEVHCIRDILVP
jgi:hypothetical protein